MVSVLGLVKMRFSSLTHIQKKAIPLVLEGKNVLVVAPTGFGKTECALLPIFERIEEKKPKGVFAIYITPLKALNRDMLERISWWCEKLGISYSVRHGDTGAHERAMQLKSPPQILITTPETFGALLCAPKFSLHLRNVRFVVVDEVHELMENKRGAQLSIALERLEEIIERAKKETGIVEGNIAKSAANVDAGVDESVSGHASAHKNERWARVDEGAGALHKNAVAVPSNFQRIGLSATLGDEQEAAKFLAGEARKCEISKLDVAREMEIEVDAPGIEEWGMGKYQKKNADETVRERVRELARLVHGKKVLVFANSRAIAEVLGARLLAAGVNALVHHGSLSKEARTFAEDEFKAGRVSVLVCTSSLELGIDIGDIGLVVQYCSPRQASRLVQRIGRSGHSHLKTPKGVVLCTDEEDRMEALAVARLAHEGFVEKEECERGALDVVAQQLAGFLLQEKRMDLWRVHAVFSRAYAYAISMGTLHEIAVQLGAQKTIAYDAIAKAAAATGRTREYYFSRLSTIPPSRKYTARNAIINSRVCTLDEKFVAGIGEGDSFIVQGKSWRVLSVEEEKSEVLIEAASGHELAVPSWEGEEIPVGEKVARLVARQKKHKDARFVAVQGIVPDEKNIVVEATEEFAVIHSAIGTRANAAICKCIAYVLMHKVRGGVKASYDAYRIMLQLPHPVPAAHISALLLSMPPIPNILRVALAQSALFRYKLAQVCRLFGHIGEQGRITKARAAVLEGNVMFAEAMRSALRSYADVKVAQETLAGISDGSIKVHSMGAQKLSFAGAFGIETAYGSDFDAPITSAQQAMEELKDAVKKKTVEFLCFNCKYPFARVVEGLGEKISCPKCAGTFVALTGEIFRGKKIRVRVEADFEVSASLISAYGLRAIYALSVYGVGVTGAASVLRKPARSESEFFANLLSAQRNFIKNRKYWKG